MSERSDSPPADSAERPLSREDVDRLVMRPTGRRRLGKYVLVGRIGHGGMGKIYLAYAPGPAGLEKLLVIKRLHSHLTSDPVLVRSFLDEARVSMALNHPNIVSTFDVAEDEGRTFMVMEYVDGQNLGVLLRTAKRSGAYPPSALWAGLFCGVLDGLHAAHEARDARGRPLHIIHRDVSPQNVLVTYDGSPKLADFGIAKAAMRVSETDAGVLKGKYAYMSPEQVRGDTLDARSDVFAAGIVLWEMLAGRRLYKADNVMRSVERILTEAAISPVRVNPDCNAEIARVAMRALQKDREQRYATAQDMKLALDDALHAQGLRPRQAEVRALMHNLFADVIARQRAVLEAALSADEALGAEVEEVVVRGPNDSESDVSLQDLHDRRNDRSSTTPRSAGRSRLVTAEAQALPDGDGAGPRQPDTLAPRVASVPAAVIVAATALLSLAAWLLLRAGSEGVVRVDSSAELRATVAEDAGSLAGRVAGGDGLEAGASAGDAGPAAYVSASDVVDAGGAANRDAGGPAVTTGSGVRITTRVKERPVPAGPASPADAGIVSAALPPGGFLSLDTVPWTVVWLGETRLGETPLVNMPVPSGALELVLINSDVGIKESYIARVKPGETFRRRLDLQ